VKRCLVLVILLWTALSAQIQVLPDIDVSGESQIKIFLYKKALPYSRESLTADSIRAFFPLSLPELPVAQLVSPKPMLRHYLNLEADTRLALEGTYRYYPQNDWLSRAGIRLSMLKPEADVHSCHYDLQGDYDLEAGEELGLNLLYYDTQGLGLNSKYTLGSLSSYHDELNIKGLHIRQMSNALRISGLDQKNSALSYRNDGLGFFHQSLLDFSNLDWGNRWYLYSERPAIHSFIEFEQDEIDKFSIHVLYDGYSFFPVPGFHWRLITDFDQQLSIVNQPETKSNDFYELLEHYRWLSFDQARRNTTMPLNLRIQLEDTHSQRRLLSLPNIRISNVTQYRVNDAVLRDSPNPRAPELYFSDVFANESRISARFGQGSLVFDQALTLSLAFMANENWVKKPYDPLFKVESSLRLERYPYHAALSFYQHYLARDHYQNPLPELLDLSISAAYELSFSSQVYLKCDNLLNSPKWQFKSLPRQDTSFYAGIIHRF
jgi:hypothetical protein